MMKKVIIIIFALLLWNTSYSAPFDYSLFKGIQPGISKTKLINILKENKYGFIEKNNDVGGKYIEAKIDFSIDGIVLDTMRINFKDKKVKGISFDLKKESLNLLKTKYDVEANCKKVLDDKYDNIYYRFDNVTIGLLLDNDMIVFFSVNIECKE